MTAAGAEPQLVHRFFTTLPSGAAAVPEGPDGVRADAARALAAVRAGDLYQAERHARDAAARLRPGVRTGPAMIALAVVHRELERFDEGCELIRPWLADGIHLRPQVRGRLLAGLADFHLQTGRTAAAAAAAREAGRSARAVEDRALRATVAVLRAQLDLLTDGPEALRAALEGIDRAGVAEHCPPAARLMLAGSLLAGGLPMRARRLLLHPEGTELRGRLPVTRLAEAYALIARAELMLAHGAAPEWAGRAARAAGAQPLPGQRGHAELAEAYIHLDTSPARAARHAELAARSFARSGQVTELAQARAVMEIGAVRAAVPQPAPAPDGDGTALLSDRELAVAKLVSDGITNRQIAVRLGLSHRTVETHLSRIFEKLGVRSRAAVAARVGAWHHAPTRTGA